MKNGISVVHTFLTTVWVIRQVQIFSLSVSEITQQERGTHSGSHSHSGGESPSLRANTWSHTRGGSTQTLQAAVLSWQVLCAVSIHNLQACQSCFSVVRPWLPLIQCLLSTASSLSNSCLYNWLCLKSNIMGTIIRYCLLHTGWKRGRNLRRKVFSLLFSKSLFFYSLFVTDICNHCMCREPRAMQTPGGRKLQGCLFKILFKDLISQDWGELKMERRGAIAEQPLSRARSQSSLWYSTF